MPATVEINGNIARMILSGELDFSTQENLGSAIDQALSAKSVKEIHVDLADTTFIDSSVIRALLKLRQQAVADGKEISLWHCRKEILEILVIGGFDLLFVIH